MTDSVFELAVRQVKPGRTDDFTTARAAFISRWRTQPGATADREFRALATMPAPLENVFIGMTAWNSPADYESASQALWGGPELTGFMDTVDLHAFGILRQTEGDPVDLATLASLPGQVLEVAVRAPKGVDVPTLDAARLDYVAALAEQPGVLASYEFAILGEPEGGRRVGMTVYSSTEGWQSAMNTAGQSAAGGRFFGVIDPTIVAYAQSV